MKEVLEWSDDDAPCRKKDPTDCNSLYPQLDLAKLNSEQIKSLCEIAIKKGEKNEWENLNWRKEL